MAKLNPIQAQSLYKFKQVKFNQTAEHIQPDEITVSHAEMAGVSEKVRNSGCFGAIASAALLVATVAGWAVML